MIKIIMKNKKTVMKVLSFVLVVGVLAIFKATALTESNDYPISKLHLIDSYVRDWKTDEWKQTYTTSYTLDLLYVDDQGNYFKGPDKTIELGDGENMLANDPHGFGVVPKIDGKTDRGTNLIKGWGIETLIYSDGAKYVFDHAEVLVGGTYHKFATTTSKTTGSLYWHIYCYDSSVTTFGGDYGWRGNYQDSDTDVAYKVNNDTKYKFVYKKVRSGDETAVDTLGLSSGVTMKLFNYSDHKTNKQENINANGVYSYFNFRNAKPLDGVGATINTKLDEDGYMKPDPKTNKIVKVNHATVLPNLDSNGYPVFDCRGEAGCTNFSLGYLFGASTNPVNQPTKGVTSYSPNNTLLQKDSNGYYYYDSNQNAVDYDIDNNQFIVRNYKEQTSDMVNSYGQPNRFEFLPFNYYTGSTNHIYQETEIDHWYGMTMEFQFNMPKDGKVKGEDMIFSFTGDDDVWVFLDGVLVLDLGGTHGAVDGIINFNTGEILGYLNWKENNYKNENAAKQGTIKEAYEKAYEKSGQTMNPDDWNGQTYKNYSQHKLTFFYLERGASVANCKIRFNMEVLPSGSVTVKKEFSGTDADKAAFADKNYEFTLYDASTDKPVTNVSYTKNEKVYTTSDGTFKLKDGETASFKLVNGKSYYVVETDSGIHATVKNNVLNTVPSAQANKTDTFKMEQDSLHYVIFTNEKSKLNLNVKKIVEYVDDTNEFDFRLTITDNNNPVVLPENPNYTIDGNKITFKLSHNEDITINGIPYGSNVKLEEIKHNGYTPIIKTSDGENLIDIDGDTYEFILTNPNKEIVVNNIPGVSLPETGSSKSLIYMVSAISLVIISLGGLMVDKRKTKEIYNK